MRERYLHGNHTATSQTLSKVLEDTSACIDETESEETPDRWPFCRSLLKSLSDLVKHVPSHAQLNWISSLRRDREFVNRHWQQFGLIMLKASAMFTLDCINSIQTKVQTTLLSNGGAELHWRENVLLTLRRAAVSSRQTIRLSDVRVCLDSSLPADIDTAVYTTTLTKVLSKEEARAMYDFLKVADTIASGIKTASKEKSVFQLAVEGVDSTEPWQTYVAHLAQSFNLLMNQYEDAARLQWNRIKTSGSDAEEGQCDSSTQKDVVLSEVTKLFQENLELLEYP